MMREIDLTQSHDVFGEFGREDYKDVRKKYTDPGTQYAFAVLEKRQMAGYLIQLACFRHLQDLKRAETSKFKYHYDLDEVNKILSFAALCPNVDTGKPTKLMGWQNMIMCSLFGWRDEQNQKRFTHAIVSVARGQGKTYFAAIVMCYSLLIETMGLRNQDLLVASINYKQTGKLYGYVHDMLSKLTAEFPFKELAESKQLKLLTDQIVEREPNNIVRAISHEAGQFDSFHFRTAVFDEIGEIKSRDKISKITSGQTNVDNHQFIQISTAYPDPSVPFHEDQKREQQVMEQDFKRANDSHLCLVWSQDSLEETFEPDTWVKSNPLLDLHDPTGKLLKGLIDERDSHAMSGTLSDFQNKNMNMWLQEATNSFLKLADIERAVIPKFNIHGRQVYIGFDYSMFSDNTAFSFVYPYQDKHGKNKWHIEQHSFIPWQKAGSIEAKEKQDGIDYRELVKQGCCTITSHPQGLINDDQVYQWLVDYVTDNELDVVFFGYDAWGATNAIKRLDLNTEWPLEPIRQRTSELKDPTKFLQTGFVENSLSRLDDKIMEQALMNAQVIEDKIGIQVDKAKATLKIDVVDAIIDAFYQAMYHFEDFADVNDPSKQVERMSEQDVLDYIRSGQYGFGNKEEDNGSTNK